MQKNPRPESATRRLLERLTLPQLLALRVLCVLLAFMCAGLLEWQRPALLTRLDEGLRDVVLRLMADPAPETRLAVIDIDDDSLRILGPWPWPRARLAELVERLLSEQGARTVALDMVLPEPAAAGADGEAGESGDARLQSLAAHAPLVLAQILDAGARAQPLREGRLSGGQPLGGNATRLSLPVAHNFVGNHAALAAAARCVGNIGFIPDADGVLRRLPLMMRHADAAYLHLAPRLLACAGTPLAARQLAELAAATETARLGGQAAGLWRLPYLRADDAYSVIPAAVLLTGQLPAASLAGRHVLVGSSALALGDRVSTPLAALTAGVMVHAQALSALLDVEAGRLAPPWSGRGWLLLWLALTLPLAALGIRRLPAWAGSLNLVLLALAWLLLAAYGARMQAEWSLTAPLAGYLLLGLLALPLELRLAQLGRQRAIATLAHYVAPAVLKELLRRDLSHSLTPRLREVTVLIADIEGYTRMTSSLSLKDAARLTKELLECLTAPLLEAGGTLDKYTGDGLVAFWGAPLDCPDHADIAVDTALAMLARVAAYNQENAAQGTGLPQVRCRIGIESGPALVGDLGTRFRSTYTAVGDCINFASRLEDAARPYEPPLLIGPQAHYRLQRHTTISRGSLQLRGTDTWVEVYGVPS